MAFLLIIHIVFCEKVLKETFVSLRNSGKSGKSSKIFGV